METLNTIQLTDENIFPDHEVLRKVLGKSYNAYLALLELYDRYELECEWRYYRDGKAWLGKVRKKKKAIVWMSAWKDYIKATIYIPERYLEKILTLGLSDEAKNRIMNTGNVGRSKPCSFEIRAEKALADLEVVMKLRISIK